VKIPNHDIHAVSGLQQPAAVRERHPVGLSGFEFVGSLAQLPDFLCAGMQAALFSGSHFSPRPDAAQFLVPDAGAVFSLWIWRRFGFSYAFLAAMIFVPFLPGYWTSSPWARSSPP